MSDYRAQFAEAIEATLFHSPTCFSWLGQKPFEIPRALTEYLSPTEVRSLVRLGLGFQLYEDFYSPGYAALPTISIPIPELETVFFVEKLEAAICGKGFSDSSGWAVKKLRRNDFIVTREGLSMRAQPKDFLHAPPSRAGSTIILRTPQALPQASPGFFLVPGDREMPRRSSKSLTRFYWNLTPGGAVHFLRAVTSTLNAAGLPFQVKVANHPSRFTRCDSGVLYVYVDNYLRVAQLVARLHATVAAYLKRGIPAFTKELAPGLSWAEDPGEEDSFGSHRCGLLAEGILRAFERRKLTLEARLKMVEICFEEEGVRLAAPYLNQGSRPRSAFAHFDEGVGRLSGKRQTTSRPVLDSQLFLRAAHQLGRQIIREAVWHNGVCNWLGADPPPTEPEQLQSAPKYRPLGPDLHSGTSGIALFLGELCAASGDNDARRTAVGAIRHSLTHLQAVPRSKVLSDHEGWTGIALAALRVGAAIKEEELKDQAANLMKRALRKSPTIREIGGDSGKSGAIVGLLLLWSSLHDSMLLEAAVRLGEALLKQIRGLADRVPGHREKSSAEFARRLCDGAYSLLNLFYVTDNARYRRGAEWALERADNYVAAREHTIFAAEESGAATEVLLSRTHAFYILKAPGYKAEALRALQTLRQTLENWRRVARGDFSLARGVSGTIQAVLYAREVFGEEVEGDYALALQVAREAAVGHSARGNASHWGSGPVNTPGLMLGRAGIARLYLRLALAAANRQ